MHVVVLLLSWLLASVTGALTHLISLNQKEEAVTGDNAPEGLQSQCRLGAQNSTTSPPQNLIPYKVPDTDITLEFFHFGAPMPPDDFMEAIVSAMESVTSKIAKGQRHTVVPNGLFKHRDHFSPDSTVITTICDFSQLGRTITWGTLGIVLRGIAIWIDVAWKRFEEMNFNVVVENVGVTAFGMIRYEGPAPPVPSTGVRGGVAQPSRAPVSVLRRSSMNGTDDVEAKKECERPPSQTADFVPYHHKGYRTSLEFIRFGPLIPADELFGSIMKAVDTALTKSGLTGGLDTHLPYGMFIHTVRFDNGDKITSTFCDFAQTGHPMTWRDVTEALRGVGRYMKDVSGVFQETFVNVIGSEGQLLGFGHTVWERKASLDVLR